jgi:hypothetical protein
MRRRSSHLLTLVLATIAILAPVAQAQERVHPPFTTQVYLYRDSDGPGRMTIIDLGSASGTNFDLIRVTLVQGGITYLGSGYSMHISPTNPAQALFFTLADHRGNDYVFSGTVTSGTGGVSGGGTYHSAGFPQWTNAWRIEGIAPGGTGTAAP